MQRQRDLTARLMTAGRCARTEDANRLGAIPLPEANVSRPARNSLHVPKIGSLIRPTRITARLDPRSTLPMQGFRPPR